MNNAPFTTKSRSTWLAALTGLALCLQAPLVGAQSLMNKPTAKGFTMDGRNRPVPRKQSVQDSYSSYILGPGDGLQIELVDLPQFSGRFSIGPDGSIYLPRLRALDVEGLTLEELRTLLTQKFSTYVRNPQVYIRPVTYRPIRIYVGGEVKRPGYYTLTGVQTAIETESTSNTPQFYAKNEGLRSGRDSQSITGGSSSATLFPTVFDAIRTAQGVTPYSNLSDVQVTRRRPQALGSGRIRTKLNFLSLITEGNESQNIRLFDGDVVSVSRSKVVMRGQLLKAGQTNLSPQFINVFLSGRVNRPGNVTIPQGSSLTQAIALGGGRRLLSGRVEFVRFTREGEIDRRTFRYDPDATADAPNNPVLMAGDLIRIQDSPLSASISVLGEITSPVVGIYSAYALFNIFQ